MIVARGVVAAAVAALVALVLLAAPVQARRGGAVLGLQAGGSEVERAKQALKAAEERVNEVQRDLEAVQERRELARAQRTTATQQLQRATVRERQLQFAIGIRARSTYMKGSPTSVAAIVANTEDPDGLLDRVATLEQIARMDNLTIKDLRTVQELAERSAADLAEAEQTLARAQASLQRKLDEADELYEERLAVFNELNVEAAREAGADLAAERVASVSGGGGGVCDLSGVPAAARELIMRESGGRPTAQNPNSTAFGLGQLLIGNRIRLMGDDYASTDCSKQFEAFSQYTLGRYGSFENALAFHNDKGWY